MLILTQGVVLSAKYPQLQAYIAGSLITEIVFLEIENVGYFAADRFKIGFAISEKSLMKVDYFLGVGGQSITISAGLKKGDFKTVIVGNIDGVEVDFYQNTVVLVGRDLSGLLIDAEISETFINQTASQIAIRMAENFGLIPIVSATSKFVGQYYEIDHARTIMSLNSKNMTAWDLLSNLAKEEGFILYVSENNLYFGQAVINETVTINLADFSELLVNYISSLSAGVTVKSWNTRRKMAVLQTVGQSVAPVIVRPNLSDSQAFHYASNYAIRANQQKLVLTGKMPLDFITMPGVNFRLTGSTSSLDQIYTIDHVRRRLHGEGDCVQSIRAYVSG